MTEIDIPTGAVVLNVLHIVEYMDADGHIYKQDFSHASDGEDLELGKALELTEWSRAFTTASMLIDMVHDHCYCSDDDDEDGVEV